MNENTSPIWHKMDGSFNESVTGGIYNTTAQDTGPEPLPLYTRVLITIMYTSVSLIAITGNVVVCYIVFAYQGMRTVTNYFIVNLACSDILVSVLCIPLTFVANLLVEYWPFGSLMCPIVSYVQVVTVFLNAFTLVAISLDRFRVIICPLKRKLGTRQAMIIIAIIWVLSLAVPLPIALLSRVVQKPIHGEMRSVCEEEWPGGLQQRTIFSFVIMTLQYFVPLFVLAFTYTWIGVIIWGKKTPGEAHNHRDERIAASKRKMVKMMITVVIIYGLCWLPLHSITIIGDIHTSIWSYEHIQTLWITCHWLAMSNCCYNPMVYCWMNTRYRNGFRYVFRFLPCIKTKDPSGDEMKSYYNYNYKCVYGTKKVRIGSGHNGRNNSFCSEKTVVCNPSPDQC